MPTVTRGGVELYWSEHGTGPVVFWHTGGGGDGSMWRRAGYLDALPGYRHLLFDHRGHGRSDKPEGLEAHRLGDYVADSLAVCDAVGATKCAFVGYSAGARVLYALAARHPDRVSAVIGIGGVSHPDDLNGADRERAHELRRRTFRAWLEEIACVESETPPRWLMENLATTPTEMFALALEAWADEPTECADFPEIQAPTLIICGEKENTEGAAELAVKALQHGSHRVLPGLGHLQAFWRSELTAPLIADFLSGHLPKGGS